MEYSYKITLPDGNMDIEKLVIESRVEQFSEDINNPTGDEAAYFYWLTINGREQLTTFKPWEEGYQPMTKEEAEKFLDDDINQTLLNFWINGK